MSAKEGLRSSKTRVFKTKPQSERYVSLIHVRQIDENEAARLLEPQCVLLEG